MTEGRPAEKLHVKDFLPIAVQALSDAGWSEQQIRAFSEETQRRMGAGGTTAEWLMAMGEVIAVTGDTRAADAYLAAFKRWTADR